MMSNLHDEKVDELFSALEKAAHEVTFEIVNLTDDIESKIYPESLVNTLTALTLKKEFPTYKIFNEQNTDTLVKAIRSLELNMVEKLIYPVGRKGKVDISVWDNSHPRYLIEVKDEIAGTDDGIFKDIERLMKFLSLENRWLKKKGKKGNHVYCAAVMGFIGKYFSFSDKQYSDIRMYSKALDVYAKQTYATIESKIDNLISTDYTYKMSLIRVKDAAKDIDEPIEEFEGDGLSGNESVTHCFICVFTAK